MQTKKYMLLIGQVATVIALAVCCATTHAEDSASKEPLTISKDSLTATIADLHQAIKRNSDDIAIIRRDEINYQVERDILKEVYTSHIQSIGLMISAVSIAVGLFFAVLGYLGFKSVGGLKDDYTAELKNVQALKAKLEQEFEELKSKQSKTEVEVDVLASKVGLIELTEKIGALINAGNYEWALEHIRVGMEVNPEYLPLLRQFAHCQVRTHEFDTAILSYRKILASKSKNAGDIQNFAELLIISEHLDDYKELYKNHKSAIDKAHNGILTIYFDTLCGVQSANLDEARKSLLPLFEKSPSGASVKMPNWQYSDLIEKITEMPEGEIKTFAEKFIGFFNGTVSTEDMRNS